MEYINQLQIKEKGQKMKKIVQNKRKLTCSERIPRDLIDPALLDNNSK